MNPCPCGYWGDPTLRQLYLLAGDGDPLPEAHQRPPARPLRHAKRAETPRVEYEKLAADRAGEPSIAIRAWVRAAREQQQARFKDTPMTCNADMGPAYIREYCDVDEAGKSLMRAATRSVQLGMSARSFHRVLKLARTIADLVGAERIQAAHLAEALQYRPRRQT